MYVQYINVCMYFIMFAGGSHALSTSVAKDTLETNVISVSIHFGGTWCIYSLRMCVCPRGGGHVNCTNLTSYTDEV